MYDFIYENENEFKRLERSLRQIDMLATKTLLFKTYPNLKNGNFKGAKKNENIFEIELPTNIMFMSVYGRFRLTFEIIDNHIKLIDILPKEILLEHAKGNTTFYKGVVILKNNDNNAYDSYIKFKIDLLNKDDI